MKKFLTRTFGTLANVSVRRDPPLDQRVAEVHRSALAYCLLVPLPLLAALNVPHESLQTVAAAGAMVWLGKFGPPPTQPPAVSTEQKDDVPW